MNEWCANAAKRMRVGGSHLWRGFRGYIMNGTRALRVIAFMSISIGIGILSHQAWGFVAFGILVLIDNFLIKSPPPAPPERIVAEEELVHH